MASAKDFFKDAEKDAIVTSIRNAEMHTSGEIRVHIDDRCDQNPFDRAVSLFQHLKMDKKPFRNAVLIYIAVKDKKFSVIGDESLHHKVGNDYWKTISHQLHEDFKAGNYGNGIIKAVETIGTTLSKYFPAIDELDRNELSDDISFE